LNSFQLHDNVTNHYIGDGSYSTVYKAIRHADKLEYALKQVKISTLTDREKENALNEVRMLASLRSPFLAPYKEAFFDQPSGTLW
jgi:NIMA (never in mitosis gene a)-related kinase 1/4/5